MKPMINMKLNNITAKNPYNKTDQPHGFWEMYYITGELRYRGNYINGIITGYWIQYYANIHLTSKTYYIR